eukprot:242538_1
MYQKTSKAPAQATEETDTEIVQNVQEVIPTVTEDKVNKYPVPPNGFDASQSATIQGFSHTMVWEEYELYFKKLDTPRNIKMDDMRDGRLRSLMIWMKDFGHKEQVDVFVKKTHNALFDRLMDDKLNDIDIYNVGMILESIACLQITKLEEEIPKILAKDIDFTNIWKTAGIGLRAFGTADLMLFLQRNDKRRFKNVMDMGMHTLQNIMILPMDIHLWKRCASIMGGLARCMTEKEYDILTNLTANIMDSLSKETVATFAELKRNKDKTLTQLIDEMAAFTKFSRQDHKDVHPFPKIIFNRALYKGEDWARDTFSRDGNPMADLSKWKAFIDKNGIDKKEWGFVHDAFGSELSDLWDISEGDDKKEWENKLKTGDAIVGADVPANYLSYLLALSDKLQPLFQCKMHDLFGDKHKEAPIKKMARCQNKLFTKYANQGVPKAAELTDTVRCLVVFDDFADLLAGYKTLQGEFSAVCRVKNGFDLQEKDVSFGYRDALINVVFDAGFCKLICEVQFTTNLFYQLRSKLHRYYTFHRCEEANQILTPCTKYTDKLVSTLIVEQQEQEKEHKSDDK